MHRMLGSCVRKLKKLMRERKAALDRLSKGYRPHESLERFDMRYFEKCDRRV